MRICLIMPNVFPVPATKGGATEMLITNLLEENEKEGKVDFICVSLYDEKAEKLSKKYKYTKFIYINQKRDNLDLTFEEADNSFIQYMDEIYENIKDEQFDFLIIEGGDITGYEYLLKRFPPEKCVVHIHGDKVGNNEINNKIYGNFLVISKYAGKLVRKDGIIPESKIQLLYNAIKLENFDKTISREEKKLLRDKFKIEEDDVVILFSGRTIPQKGVKQLIQSFKKLKNIEKCKLLIVGSANYGERVKTEFDCELEELAKDIQDKIKFTGYIENEELYKVHNISDIAVVPSMWEELFGLVVVESMSSGLPLVVTKSGGIPEIVDEKCAYIIEKDEMLIDNLAKKLDYLIENPDIRKEMGICAKISSKKYSMQQYLENFIEIMNRI